MTATRPREEPLRVVVADPNLLPHRDAFEAGLPAGATVSWHERLEEAALLDDLPGAHVLVASRFTAAMAEVADSLRLVHVGGAGYDGIDEAALPPGSVCANTFHHEASIAEYIVATTVVMRRGIVSYDRELRSGHWASSVYEPERPQADSIEGATVGIVGYGNIGRRTWRVLRAMGAQGVVVTRSDVDVEGEGLRWAARPEELHRLLAESDVVVLCLPLSDATRHLVSRAELVRMRPGALLVNVSRGPLVDPEALYEALSERRIGGAVLDVWYRYPTSGSSADPAPVPFGSLDNVLMTPHISGVTRQTFEGRVREITANIRRLGEGKPLVNVVMSR